MTLRITARNKMDVAPRMREVIAKKCERLGRHFDKVDQIEVVMQEEKFRFRVEILVSAGQFHGAALTEDDDLGRAFDNSYRRVQKQIARQKERKQATPRTARATATARKRVAPPVD
ncbi:MAG: ribosome-associated translation inhibitor RaiA [Candidatus Sumerlaeia bacterium]|nr:ribosome-associated translation inhibitor RaiA [Candidatus Sumerlaeia bacterium]